MPRSVAALLLLALPRALGLQLQEGADPDPEQAREDELKYSTVTGPASGDPKILGLYGKRFQIHRPGDHALLVVPNAKKRHGSLLEVSALVKELEIGDPCLLFIKKITLTGSWLGGTTVQVRAQGTSSDFALKVDPKKHDSPWKPFKNMTGWEQFIHKDEGSGMVTTVKGVIGRREGHSEDIKGPFEHRFLFRVGTEDQKAKKLEIDVSMPKPGRQYLTVKVAHVKGLGEERSKSLQGLLGLDSKAVTKSYETHQKSLEVREECKDSATGTKASELLALSGGLSRAIAHWE
ncbi:unnamed protein product [Prorocentrum cordatum]|uniref:Uncharacterized protein n=1 Tax=Prorocentrum cordatum TaxID=2364126 RepID=A0ABN9VL74_9DINO|nr:unnamed protein product [Polarella glacialis]CAK0874061.1 unnamed protein product [Polarella glacialis]